MLGDAYASDDCRSSCRSSGYPSRRTLAWRKLVAAIIDAIPIEDYDVTVARRHSGLLAHARRAGQPRGAHDLVIAATAVARQRIVVTADARAFEGLPGVICRATR